MSERRTCELDWERSDGLSGEAPPIETLAELPAYNAKVMGGKMAFSFEGRKTTFAEFDAHTNRVAQGLIALGLRPEARIAYLGKNSDWYFELLFGAMKAGIVLAPIGWRLAGPEIAFILDNSEGEALFVETEFLEVALKAAAEAPRIGTIVVMDAEIPGRPCYKIWRDAQPAEPPAIRIAQNDICVQIYTSGTTGRPKGVMLMHRNIIAVRKCFLAQNSAASKYQPDDIALQAMPVSHIGGTSTGVWAMYHGIGSVVARQFEASRLLDHIEQDRVNTFFVVPSALQSIVRDPRAKTVDFSRMRYINYGGSSMPESLLAESIEVFGCGFLQGYGMTETSATIVQLPPEDHVLGGSPRLRSCGKPLPGVEIEIRDPSGKKLEAHKVGEIVVRSPSNMAGYWRNPEATAKTVEPDGWLHTGDAGYFDEDDYLYIHDRIKDMIISGGENIYPAEVENAIFGHPAVAEVAVIGVPSERWGEEVKAIIVPKADAKPDAADILAWARQRIAGFKVPKSIEFIAEMPRSGVGKVVKNNLRQAFAEAAKQR